MNIKYKIIKINPNEHCIVVRFYTDVLTEEKLCAQFDSDGNPILAENGKILSCRTDYNLAMWQVPPPTGQELEDLIMKNAPVAWFQLQEKILDPSIDTSMSDLIPLVDVEKKAIAK